jgi:hypothetical protein
LAGFTSVALLTGCAGHAWDALRSGGTDQANITFFTLQPLVASRTADGHKNLMRGGQDMERNNSPFLRTEAIASERYAEASNANTREFGGFNLIDKLDCISNRPVHSRTKILDFDDISLI